MGDSEINVVPGHDGLFAIMFHDKEGLPDSKVREDFEKFGIIVNIRRVGPVGFVRYAERFEAVECLKEMSTNPSYLARIPDSKRGQRTYDRPQNKGGRHSYGRDSDTNNKFNQRVTDDFSKTNNQSREKWNESQTNENKGFDRTPRNYSKADSTNSPDDLPHLIDLPENMKSPHSTSSFSGSHDNPPPLKPLVNVVWEKSLGQLPAASTVEVIVGNLPVGVFQSELYELCAIAEPLQIDNYFTGRCFQIHYASVYVKTIEHARILIAELDGQFLEDNQLVVSLASTIMNEYQASLDSQSLSQVM